jgi:hypothetical protein
MLLINAQVPTQTEKRATCVVGFTNWYSRLGVHNVEMTQLNLNIFQILRGSD